MVHGTLERPSGKTIIGRSPATMQMVNLANRAATTHHTLLLRGETGAGKDYLAAYIHYADNGTHPFVTVDCGALTEGLSENELFGHVPGAYTDARQTKPGLIEIARNGTLFFNEIANMSLGLQAKFLRILDKGSFRVVGGTTEMPINTRIVAATNADLEEGVQRGQFRLDLYYRLNQIAIQVPPLRDRPDDIPDLARFFLQQDFGHSKEIAPDAMAVMVDYYWPGNVRELRNAVTRAAFLSADQVEIRTEHVRPYLCGIGGQAEFRSGTERQVFPMFEEVEEKYFLELIKRFRGNIRKCASVAGVSKPTIYNKIKQYGLTGLVASLRKGEET